MLGTLLRAVRLAQERCPRCGRSFQLGWGGSTTEHACPQGHYIFDVVERRRVVWRDAPHPLLPGEPYSR